MNITNLTIQQLHQHYRDADFTPEQLTATLLKQAASKTDDNSWIHLCTLDALKPFLDKLKHQSIDDLPLYGIPFAIKDNIDLAGIPTTAACKDFSYIPEHSAFVVQRLLDAGAIPLGKTNLDQFATGLVGTRSPYGATRNAFKPEFISGGSSSGSAVTVAQGLVSFSLGTDTAGSGRVPAAFNNIIGLKTSRGLLSNCGVVPACRSLDCVAIFATTTDDLQTIFEITAQFDKHDAFARHNPKNNQQRRAVNEHFSFAVPETEQLEFFGNADYQLKFNETVSLLQTLGGKKTAIDFSPFLDAARLLYEGPWVTERYLATRPLIDHSPDSFLKVTRDIISQGKNKLATEAFTSQYQLRACKQKTDALLSQFDFMLTPTAGTIYTIDDVNADPVQLNSRLGYYTNYMNLLDYASIAVPAGFTSSQFPFGVTLVSDAFSDQKLLAFANRLHHAGSQLLGATQWPLPAITEKPRLNTATEIVVCGAHMQCLPLNHQLTDRGATLVEVCKTAAAYRMIALPGGPPARPGLLRDNTNGVAIDVEVWSIDIDQLGSFLQGIPQPLGLGKTELYDGRWAIGFICEAYIQDASEDISAFGGWRAFMNNSA